MGAGAMVLITMPYALCTCRRWIGCCGCGTRRGRGWRARRRASRRAAARPARATASAPAAASSVRITFCHLFLPFSVTMHVLQPANPCIAVLLRAEPAVSIHTMTPKTLNVQPMASAVELVRLYASPPCHWLDPCPAGRACAGHSMDSIDYFAGEIRKLEAAILDARKAALARATVRVVLRLLQQPGGRGHRRAGQPAPRGRAQLPRRGGPGAGGGGEADCIRAALAVVLPGVASDGHALQAPSSTGCMLLCLRSMHA